MSATLTILSIGTVAPIIGAEYADVAAAHGALIATYGAENVRYSTETSGTIGAGYRARFAASHTWCIYG